MTSFLKRLSNEFVFGNYFIAVCTAAMLGTTFLMNQLPLIITPSFVFLFAATFILYNFHRISYRLDYSGVRNVITSFTILRIKPASIIIYILSLITMIVAFFFLSEEVLLILLPLSALAIAYSIPMLFYRSRRIRLPEFPLIKTPVVALVWGVSTTLIPLAEQNISLNSPFIWLQIISRCLFVYALCIPFEMRDFETDKDKNIRTFPVVHGIRTTKIFGAIVLFLEIITHHLMQPVTLSTIIMLDISSIVAFMWIIFQNKSRKPYYYKLLVDGTMLLRFLLLLVVIRFK